MAHCACGNREPIVPGTLKLTGVRGHSQTHNGIQERQMNNRIHERRRKFYGDIDGTAELAQTILHVGPGFWRDNAGAKVFS